MPSVARACARLRRLSSAQGSTHALFNLGFGHERGDGVARDAKKAVAYYRKAADAGDASAQLNLGNCYKKGDGVNKDLKEALKW